MNSEKVKEIKEKLKERYYYLDQAYSDHIAYGGKADEQQEEEIYFLGDIRTLINELESENERLKKLREVKKRDVAKDIIKMFSDKNYISEQDLIDAIAKRYGVK